MKALHLKELFRELIENNYEPAGFGTGRVVFTKNNKAIKIALNHFGTMQNKNEYRMSKELDIVIPVHYALRRKKETGTLLLIEDQAIPVTTIIDNIINVVFDQGFIDQKGILNITQNKFLFDELWNLLSIVNFDEFNINALRLYLDHSMDDKLSDRFSEYSHILNDKEFNVNNIGVDKNNQLILIDAGFTSEDPYSYFCQLVKEDITFSQKEAQNLVAIINEKIS